jgi:hypothetical protein
LQTKDASDHAGTAGAPSQEQRHLIQSSSIFRHGARLPIHTHHAIATQAGWGDADFIDRVSEALPPVQLLHTATGEPLPLPTPHFDPETGPLHFGEKQQPAGTLTGKGFRQMQSVGQELRSRYRERPAASAAPLLPEDAASATASGALYLRSTHIPRTVQSLQGVVSGLYPEAFAPAGDAAAAPASGSPTHPPSALPVYTLSTRHEYLYPNARDCPALIDIATQGECPRFNFRGRGSSGRGSSAATASARRAARRVVSCPALTRAVLLLHVGQLAGRHDASAPAAAAEPLLASPRPAPSQLAGRHDVCG